MPLFFLFTNAASRSISNASGTESISARHTLSPSFYYCCVLRKYTEDYASLHRLVHSLHSVLPDERSRFSRFTGLLTSCADRLFRHDSNAWLCGIHESMFAPPVVEPMTMQPTYVCPCAATPQSRARERSAVHLSPDTCKMYRRS